MLKPEHFSYKCPLKISDLEETENGHFCAKCSKDIHDLTDCSLDEIRELQRRKGSLCGFVRAVSVTSMVGLAACSKNDNTSTANPPEQPDAIDTTQRLLGEVCVPEDNTPKPEPAKPDEPPKNNGATSGITPQPEDPAEGAPEIEEVKAIKQPMILGIICPPDQLKPGKVEEPKALDPNREGSPG